MLRMVRAQILSEYLILISVIVLALVTMFPLVKRSNQRLTKIAADQIGNQANSDQDYNSESGYLINMVTQVSAKATDDDWYIPDASGKTYDDEQSRHSLAYTNQGFTKDQEPSVSNWVLTLPAVNTELINAYGH